YLVFVDFVRHDGAGDARDGLFLLHEAAIAADGPDFFHLVGERMNEKGPVQFAPATRDVHAAFNLQRLAARDFVVQKLIGVRIRGGTPNAAADINFDADGGVR